MQRGLADVWKENILKNLEADLLEYETTREFLMDLKKKFGGEEKTVKTAELRRLEQGGKAMEKFIQEFKIIVRESRYKRRLLIKEFK